MRRAGYRTSPYEMNPHAMQTQIAFLSVCSKEGQPVHTVPN
jgi:hypothetical protein